MQAITREGDMANAININTNDNYNKTGNVTSPRAGIGTDTPVALLELKGGAAISGVANLLTIQGGSTTVTTSNNAFQDGAFFNQ